jgi:hypothetical protein
MDYVWHIRPRAGSLHCMAPMDVGKKAHSDREQVLQRAGTATPNPLQTNAKHSQGVGADWTMTHSLFAQMGGFAFDTATHGVEYIPGSPRLYLTANGVAALARLGRLPRVSRAFISDKSKADGLAKALATVQASWLIVQCLGRTVGGLPVSLLECNALAHALCSLVMYCLWWSKPLNVADPMVLAGGWAAEVCAAMWMLSEASTFAATEDIKPPEIVQFVRYERQESVVSQPHSGDLVIEMKPTKQDDEMPRTMASSPIHREQTGKTPELVGLKNSLQSSEMIVATTRLEPGRWIETQPAGFLIKDKRGSHLVPTFSITKNRVLLPLGFSLDDLRQHFPQNIIDEFFTKPKPTTRKCPTAVHVTKTALTRWRLATQCYDARPDVWAQHKTKTSEIVADDGTLWTTSQYPVDRCHVDYVAGKVPNWPGNDLFGGSAVASHLFFGTACTLLYATIHALAWRGYFPTERERTMWIVSAAGIGASALVGLVVYSFWSLVERTVVEGKGLVGGCMEYSFVAFRTVFAPMSTFVACIVAGFYVFARFFLVFEAFFSLRALPVEMYLAPQWTQYLSHL